MIKYTLLLILSVKYICKVKRVQICLKENICKYPRNTALELMQLLNILEY